MKQYNFEYTNQSISYLLLLLSFAIVALVGFLLVSLFKNVLLLDIILSIVLGIGFFLFNKRRIKKVGKAELSETGIVLELAETKHVAFSELKYYYVYDGKNGIVFTLGLINGSKVKLGANNNFCNIEPFRTLLTDFQSAIDKYNAENQLSIIHLQSILARKNAIYILSFITILIILGFILTTMPIMIIFIGFTLPILINWIQYLRLKRNNNLVDF